jgi:ribosomal protein L11 methyltransferase
MISILLEFPRPIDIQQVSEWLMSLGACAVEVSERDAGEEAAWSAIASAHQQQLQQLESNTAWNSSRTFRVLLSSDVSPENFLMDVASVSDWNSVKVLSKVAVEEEDDWVQRVRESFQPIRIGKLYIRCPWHSAPETAKWSSENALVDMIIHPGMGFGTGEHTTTRLCLSWLQKTIRGGEKLLDYGSGSGILSIAAYLLGCELCHGVEIDLDSIRNAEENKHLNGISKNVCFYQPMEAPSLCYDIIVANILFHPLVDLAEKFAKCSRIGTQIALSGIIYSQAENLKETYQGLGFQFEDTIVEKEWCLIVGRKKESVE